MVDTDLAPSPRRGEDVGSIVRVMYPNAIFHRLLRKTTPARVASRVACRSACRVGHQPRRRLAAWRIAFVLHR